MISTVEQDALPILDDFPGLLDPWPPELLTFEQARQPLSNANQRQACATEKTDGLLLEVNRTNIDAHRGWSSNMSASTASVISDIDIQGLEELGQLPSAPPTNAIVKDPFTNYRKAIKATAKALASVNNKTLIDSQWAPELLQMELKELNRWIKQANLPSHAVQELKEARRRRKNRMYAKRSRRKQLARGEADKALSKTSLLKELENARTEIAFLKANQSKMADFIHRMETAGKLTSAES